MWVMNHLKKRKNRIWKVLCDIYSERHVEYTNLYRFLFCSFLIVVYIFIVIGMTLAIPAVMPIQEYETLITTGQLEVGRAGFRSEIARLIEQFKRVEGETGIDGLAKRISSINELNIHLVSWANAEAKALYTKKATSREDAIKILEKELLPLAQRIHNARDTYLLEASQLEAGMDQSFRLSKGWVFDAVRWSEEARAKLPMSLARLAKISESRNSVKKVFEAFRGRVGTFTTADDYYNSQEDYGRVLGLTIEENGKKPPPLIMTPDEVGEIRTTLNHYYQSLVRQDVAGIRDSLAQNSPQAEEIIQGMGRRRDIVNIGNIGHLSVERLPDGSVKAIVEDIPITFIKDGREVIQEGSQVFIMTLEKGKWKILHLGR